MKINGKKPGAFEDWFIIPRPAGDFALYLKAVQSYDFFNKVFPEPQPVIRQKPDGTITKDTSDAGYLQQMQTFFETRTAWWRIETIRYTPGLEFETIVLDDWSTFKNFEKELLDAGLSRGEYNQLLLKINEINGIDSDKLEEARARFLLTLGQS